MTRYRYAILLPLVAASVQAQTSSDGRKAVGKEVFEEIIVTATRRSESVRDIPVSIDAFSGDALDSRGLDTLNEILRYSPGVYLQPGNTPDSNQINIRGGSSSSGDFNRPFGIFYDDVAMINPTFVGTQPEFDPFDMRTVEVLKGPQGTYFGGSALLGAVRYVPNQPDLNGTYGALSYGYGTTEESDDTNMQATGMVNYAFSDRFAVRLAGSIRDRAGVIDDTFTGEKDVDGTKLTHWRAMATWKVMDPLSVTFAFQDRSMRADANVATTIDNEDGRQENGRRRGGPDGSESDQQIAQVKLDWQATDALLLSLNVSRTEKSGHSYSSAFITNLAGVDVVNPFDKYEDDTRQYTYELRAVHDTPTQSDWALFRDWTYVAGLYYGQSDQRMHLSTLFDFNNPPEGFPFPTNVLTGFVRLTADAKETALYFDATRPLSERFELNLGGRLFEQRTPATMSLHLFGLLASTPVDPPAVLNQKLDENGFNPRVALTWHATDDISTYVSAARGYRYGGVNLNIYNSPTVPDTFDSDSVWNYELGTRTTWLDGRLLADVTAFYIDWSDRQTSNRTPTDPSVEYMTNTGKWTIKGVEMRVQADLSHGFTWSMNGAYVDSTSKDPYVNDNGVLVPPGTQELSTPRWNASTVLAYAGQTGPWDINAALGYAYRAKAVAYRYLSDDPDPSEIYVPLDAYDSVDAMFSIGNSEWPMSPVLSLDITNLTNSDALIAHTATGGPSDPGRTVAAKTLWPRTIMLNLKFSFGQK